MTQNSWLETLGVPFQATITVAFHTVFTGLCQLYACREVTKQEAETHVRTLKQ